MKYPILNEIPTSRDMIGVFGGYNHNLRIGDGELYDMKNLSSADYPVLAPRKKRGTYPLHSQNAQPSALIAKDSLCYYDDKTHDFVINGYAVAIPHFAHSDKPISLVSMGAYVIIMPHKYYINTASYHDDGSTRGFLDAGYIEASFSGGDATTFELCKIDGESYKEGETKKSSTAPEITEEMKEDPSKIPLWLDTSSNPNVLRQYSTSQEQWTAVATTYIKISCLGIGESFSVNDAVTISGIRVPELSDFNNKAMIVWAKDINYIVVKGIINYVATQNEGINVERKMPDMDFIIESQNRLWGCKYGITEDGKMVNAIYASKLGDFKNWNCFAGISTDSYEVSLGTDGQFTGAINYLGYPIFFKENCMHKVYGNYPAQYQAQTTTCRGVQKGCSKSLAIVNEVLYYKSRSAVCAYDGSLPMEISAALGDIAYHDAVAGTLGNKYYISMLDNKEVPHLFVYDTARGMWHKEDNTDVKDFCTCRGDLYFIDNTDNRIKSVLGSGDPESFEKTVPWVAETGVWGTEYPDRKYISRLDIRMSLNVGTRVVFLVEYDSSGKWEHLFTTTGTSLRTFSVPVKPRRCDHLRLRIEGDGEAKIYSICRTIEQGSDI